MDFAALVGVVLPADWPHRQRQGAATSPLQLQCVPVAAVRRLASFYRNRRHVEDAERAEGTGDDDGAEVGVDCTQSCHSIAPSSFAALET